MRNNFIKRNCFICSYTLCSAGSIVYMFDGRGQQQLWPTLAETRRSFTTDLSVHDTSYKTSKLTLTHCIGCFEKMEVGIDVNSLETT